MKVKRVVKFNIKKSHNDYPSLKELFLQYIEENKQFTTLFYKIVCEFSKLKGYSVNSKIV